MKINTVETVIQDFQDGQNIFRRQSVELMIREISRLQSLVQELEQERLWISVDERLPEINKTVLVVCGSVTIAKRKVDIIKNYCWVEIDGMELKHVTHWQSLPKLPQEEE